MKSKQPTITRTILERRNEYMFCKNTYLNGASAGLSWYTIERNGIRIEYFSSTEYTEATSTFYNLTIQQ